MQKKFPLSGVNRNTASIAAAIRQIITIKTFIFLTKYIVEFLLHLSQECSPLALSLIAEKYEIFFPQYGHFRFAILSTPYVSLFLVNGNFQDVLKTSSYKITPVFFSFEASPAKADRDTLSFLRFFCPCK